MRDERVAHGCEELCGRRGVSCVTSDLCSNSRWNQVDHIEPVDVLKTTPNKLKNRWRLLTAVGQPSRYRTNLANGMSGRRTRSPRTRMGVAASFCICASTSVETCASMSRCSWAAGIRSDSSYRCMHRGLPPLREGGVPKVTLEIERPVGGHGIDGRQINAVEHVRLRERVRSSILEHDTST